MWNNPNILHESVADVLTDLGVKEAGGKTNPPNNAAPKVITEQETVSAASEKKKKKVLHDETDGEPDTTTTVKMDTDPDVNTEEANTEVNVEGELSAAEKIAEAFYDSLDKHIVIVWEGEDWDNAEIFGLTAEDIAPVGGTPPAVTAKYRKAADKAKTRVDGKGYDALMLHATKNFGNGGNDVIGGAILQTVGWTAPERGKGRKVASGSKNGKMKDKGNPY